VLESLAGAIMMKIYLLKFMGHYRQDSASGDHRDIYIYEEEDGKNDCIEKPKRVG
jgi:hypothetical protein